MNNACNIAFILAGGKSSRMGQNKALLELNGKSLLLRTAEMLEPKFKTVVISGDYPEYHSYSYPRVPDLEKEKGPLGGLYSCLQTLNENEYAFFVSCDTPLLSLDLIEQLSQKINGQDALVFRINHKAQPLVGFYNKRCFETLKEQLRFGNLSVNHLLNLLNVHYEDIDGLKAEALTNVNTPSEFNALKTHA